MIAASGDEWKWWNVECEARIRECNVEETSLSNASLRWQNTKVASIFTSARGGEDNLKIYLR